MPELLVRRWSRATLLALALAAGGCASLHPGPETKPPSQAIAPAWDTPSTRYVHDEMREHADQSGFRLLTKSTNALLSRIALIDHAAHSVDLQYYIFNDDATGRLVAQRLLAAADRGVRVRLLVDDMTLDDKDHMFERLDAHENIEVRRFNPFRTHAPSAISKAAQLLVEGPRLNRRMHNKSFIVDNAVAIVGGRNIGDGYFDASSETNFRDLDTIAIGPVVPEASAAFDAYWNSEAAVPVEAFHKRRASAADLAELRAALKQHAREFAESDYAQAALEDLPNGPTADRRGAWFWGNGELVADEPEKVELRKDEPAFRIGPKVRKILDAAQHDVLLITPYLVPGTSGTQYLTGLAGHGIDVEALTNSLASTDEPAAFAGYTHYRRELLGGGVKLFELRPLPGAEQAPTAYGTSSGVALHAKAIVVDTRYTFIGSMNIDQRSKLLNTEMGVIVDCPPLAKAVADFFHDAVAPTSAYQVTLDDSGLSWHGSDHGAPVVLTTEPGATSARKLEVSMLELLPLDGLL